MSPAIVSEPPFCALDRLCLTRRRIGEKTVERNDWLNRSAGDNALPGTNRKSSSSKTSSGTRWQARQAATTLLLWPVNRRPATSGEHYPDATAQLGKIQLRHLAERRGNPITQKQSRDRPCKQARQDRVERAAKRQNIRYVPFRGPGHLSRNLE
jgi:hypothetical protein